ncbi:MULTISPECIES: ImmA/IrrE family metallo-endopeptidase [unclassified Fusibacter]|uniref:ImmA/IrrE family metallo-endopeptidase n=1 Tax=unclassified Fusibacter TaxID=2624464 RepID=UPI00101326F7|nr:MULTISPECIES: ImmA/IrrE family metallo-endopeptidase [unclassified Fusibacter]MCK8058425.1 ImmA/IrrE family metallo-endopeptidase [Fusibacter sp. A2]NPE22807.1 ImmA/IrrE family metallo-endopeptidase [Fusibacter sp. A1]RXV60363.1 ImmA/IrrE family metallo-endopeptidase [Fusibacter sp. A1]
MELFTFLKKFPKIAVFNAMLINIQKPGSVYVANANDWKIEFNRTIIPGSRPLVILKPFSPVDFVFDLSDTEGPDPFPKRLLEPFHVNGNISDTRFNRLISNLTSYGIRFLTMESGTHMAGYIEETRASENDFLIKRTRHTQYRVENHYNIVVNKKHKKEDAFATILHELGHLFCGHLGMAYPGVFKDRSAMTLNIMEFEAECVSWLVCEREGLKNPSKEYLAGYLDKNEYIPPICIESVLKAVTLIENMMSKSIVRHKRIIAHKMKLSEK